MKGLSHMTRAELVELVRDLEEKAVLNAAQQIEHHRQTRFDLLDSAERMRAILETAVEGIITTDERGIIKSFNRAAEKIFGYSASEAIGQNVKILMPEAFGRQHVGTGREVSGRRKDGSVFPLELSVSELRLANARMFTGFVRDITQRKESEKALRHYAALVESSDDAIIGETLEGQIISWNRGAEMVFGYSRREAVGKRISILMPPERQNEEQAILAKIRRGESVEHYETVRQRKDGKRIQISVTVSPLRDDKGKIIGASKVARDITEQKRLETEVAEISNREQQRIGQDLHDGLCQELAGIQLMCQVLEQKLVAKSKPDAELAAEIRNHVREAIGHTRKLARGLSPVELETNGLVSALHELADHARNLLQIDCRFECATPILVRDNVAATHLYRITQEAINNAVKHGKAKSVLISLRPDYDRNVLTVTDDGVGFSTDDRKSPGMGLHTMKYRAGVVGATLQLRSGINAGVTVTCVFSRDL